MPSLVSKFRFRLIASVTFSFRFNPVPVPLSLPRRTMPCYAAQKMIFNMPFKSNSASPRCDAQVPRKASKRLYVYPMNGRLSVLSSPPLLRPASVCARSCAELSTCGISSIGKYCVSTLLCSFGSNGARILRSPSHCTPWKKGCLFSSAAPSLLPMRFWESQMRLEGVSTCEAVEVNRLTSE